MCCLWSRTPELFNRDLHGPTAEIQPAFAQGLTFIIAMDVPHQREGSVLPHPSGVRITTDLLLWRHEY